MVAVAFLMLWAGYGLGDFGWCLFRDYDITLPQLLSPVHPYAGAWPPGRIPAGQLWPTGKAAAAAAAPAPTAAAAPSRAAAAGTAAARSPGVITKIADLLPGFGFIK